MLKPLANRVVIKRLEVSDKIGNIFIPQAAQEKPSEGEVLAVGPGKIDINGQLIPTGLNVGDKVLFGKYVGTELTVKGEKVIIMSSDDILGVL